MQAERGSHALAPREAAWRASRVAGERGRPAARACSLAPPDGGRAGECDVRQLPQSRLGPPALTPAATPILPTRPDVGCADARAAAPRARAEAQSRGDDRGSVPRGRQ